MNDTSPALAAPSGSGLRLLSVFCSKHGSSAVATWRKSLIVILQNSYFWSSRRNKDISFFPHFLSAPHEFLQVWGCVLKTHCVWTCGGLFQYCWSLLLLENPPQSAEQVCIKKNNKTNDYLWRSIHFYSVISILSCVCFCFSSWGFIHQWSNILPISSI